ncbi:L-seryl-tRNA(Sec) selenium transferase, partial [Verrucosispora sp. SN26_14.1]
RQRKADVVPSAAVVGGGGAPGVELDSWALSLPERYAAPLRTGEPPVLGRVARGRLLLDLRCVPEHADPTVRAAVLAVPDGD